MGQSFFKDFLSLFQNCVISNKWLLKLWLDDIQEAVILFPKATLEFHNQRICYKFPAVIWPHIGAPISERAREPQRYPNETQKSHLNRDLWSVVSLSKGWKSWLLLLLPPPNTMEIASPKIQIRCHWLREKTHKTGSENSGREKKKDQRESASRF